MVKELTVGIDRKVPCPDTDVESDSLLARVESSLAGQVLQSAVSANLPGRADLVLNSDNSVPVGHLSSSTSFLA